MQELIINQSIDAKPEIFETVQGEGLNAGLPAIFIRLQGCDVHCAFCDEKDTWLRRENNSLVMSVEAILDYISSLHSTVRRVVITGGEPTQQELKELILALMIAGYEVAIETAATGYFTVDLFYDYPKKLFVTFSPKEIYSTTKIADERIWAKADEIKFVIANAAARDYTLNTIIPNLQKINHLSHKASSIKPVFLVPDWFNLSATKDIAWQTLRENPEILRMGFQSHKLLEMP
jgi:7-carboxy-7-deazaguanine synthase